MSVATIFDKSTGEELDAVPVDDATSTGRAVSRSEEVFRSSRWSVDAALRQVVLLAWAEAVERHAEELIDLLVRETGKVRSECARELELTVDALRFNAGMARVVGGSAQSLSDGSAGHLIREPTGPAAFIVPWNWPVFLLFRDLSPALAAGVTAVVKPAPQTPLSIRRVVELIPQQAPAGLVEVVHGGGEVGHALSSDPRVRVVAFTGSTEVGRKVAQSAVSHFAKPVLELGGKGASLIYDDADVEEAVSTSVRFGFITAGQMCMANSRILVQRSLYGRVRDLVCDRVQALRVGHPADTSTDIGALISREQADRVQGYVSLAKSERSLLLGGNSISNDGLAGAFLEPAVIGGDDINPRIRREEIFGPVVTVEPFDTDEEGIALANETNYGLAAAVWTQHVDRAWRSVRALRFGTVWVNRYNRTFAEVPSGGTKESGMGRTRGFEGVHEFTELKHINWNVS